MDNNIYQIDDLKQQIKLLQEQNEKLEITTRFYKMKYEEGLETLKQEQNELIESITEKSEFKYHYKYPKADITADGVIFGYDKDSNELKLLLVERGQEPFKGCPALPGGFLEMRNGRKESMEECAKRELIEETHFEAKMLEQFHVYSAPDRDPRGRVVTVAFLALVKMQDVEGGDDAQRAFWVSLNELPDNLAFDHRKIIEDARQELKRLICFKPVVFDLLDKTFTLRELQNLYEIILDLGPTEGFDRRNFKKKMLAMNVIQVADETQIGNSKTIATQYTFDHEAYLKMKEGGFKLEF